MNLGRTRRPPAIVDLTPLIDIIFQLVLFFMVSTTFVTSPGIEVDLPRSSADTILKERDDLKIWVKADGTILLGDTPVDAAGLRAAFSNAAAKDPSTLVLIQADKAVDHGRVVGVMDAARAKGLSHLAIATEANVAGDGSGEE